MSCVTHLQLEQTVQEKEGLEETLTNQITGLHGDLASLRSEKEARERDLSDQIQALQL